MKKCCVEGCKNEGRAKGYCRSHYHQILTYGKIRVFEFKERIHQPLKKRDKMCCVAECDKKVLAKDMCSKHYTRVRVHGDSGISYQRKPHEKPMTMMREERRYRLTADEKGFLSCIFKEAVGVNEGENSFTID